mmetsp:Transcript_17335/g.30927  ORF Transcript_17335/g.30927 Transcript_17335/m.30927 type:complete len:214 (+) Transcript_17335:1097-1738(+)
MWRNSWSGMRRRFSGNSLRQMALIAFSFIPSLSFACTALRNSASPMQLSGVWSATTVNVVVNSCRRLLHCAMKLRIDSAVNVFSWLAVDSISFLKRSSSSASCLSAIARISSHAWSLRCSYSDWTSGGSTISRNSRQLIWPSLFLSKKRMRVKISCSEMGNCRASIRAANSWKSISPLPDVSACSKASLNPVPRATSMERRLPTTWSTLDLGN